jgi:hypothetical protein
MGLGGWINNVGKKTILWAGQGLLFFFFLENLTLQVVMAQCILGS